MDIAKISTTLSQAQVKQQASLSVMKLVLDKDRIQAGEGLDLLDTSPEWNSTHPYLGGKIDIQG